MTEFFCLVEECNGHPEHLQRIHCRLHDGQQAPGTIYTGVTSELPGRVFEHRTDARDGFTKKYGLHRLVWYERHTNMKSAIQRETSIKRYKREWRINLIESDNPHWDDLYPSLIAVNKNSPLLK